MKRTLTLYIILILALVQFFAANRWTNEQVIVGDGHGYYAYLPALVLYQDLTFSWQKSLKIEEQEKYWLYPTKGDALSPKMTLGLSLIWLPGYVLATIIEWLLGESTNGWGPLFQLSVGLSAIVMLLLGCASLLDFLSRRFSALISGLAVLLLFSCTNLFYYSTIESSMSHVYSFSLLAIALNQLELYLIRAKPGFLFGSAFTIGLMILIRPTNVVLALILLGLIADYGWFKLRIKHLVSAFIVGIIPISLQLIFWKYNTDEWIYYSYGEEQIYWLNPNILSGFFSFRNGWFVYTPIALLSIIGLILSKESKWFKASIAAALAIHIYITFSWWCWYYGDSLSIRPMIETYAIIGIGLAALIHWIMTKREWIWLICFLIAVLLISNNFIQTSQYQKGQLTGSTMTKRSFFELFFETEPPRNMAALGYYWKPDNDNLRAGLPERTDRDTIVEFDAIIQDFELIEKHQLSGFRGNGQLLSGNFNYSAIGAIEANKVKTTFDRVLELSVWVKCNDFKTSEPLFVVQTKQGEEVSNYQTIGLHELDLPDSKWVRVTFFYKPEKDLSDDAKIETLVWMLNPKGEITVDEIGVRLLDCPWKE